MSFDKLIRERLEHNRAFLSLKGNANDLLQIALGQFGVTTPSRRENPIGDAGPAFRCESYVSGLTDERRGVDTLPIFH